MSPRQSSALREGWAPIVAAVVAVALVAVDLPQSRDFALDDAWIHLSYAKSLRLGDGMSYNPSDWETGFSSPLWVLLLAIWPIGGDPVVPVKALGALLHGVTAWTAGALALRLGRDRASIDRPVPLWSITALAGVLVATTPPLVEGAASGMEVPLAAATLLGAATAAVAGAVGAAGVLGLAAAWARPEALPFLLALGVGLAAWRRRAQADPARVRAPLAAAAGAVAGLGIWVVYCLIVSGQPWPNTQYVKGGDGDLGGLTYLATQVLPWQPWLVSLTGVVLLGLAVRREAVERRPEVIVLLGAAVATAVAIAVTRPLHPGVQFYEARYFAPLAAIPAAVAPFGLLGRRRVLAAVLVLPLAVVTSLQLTEVRAVARAHEEDTRVLHTAAAQWVATHLPPDAVVAVEGAGAMRYFTPRTMTIVDLVGLNDRRAAQLHHDRTAKLCHFVRRDPTHMVMPADWVPQFDQTFALRPLAAFDDPSYTQVAPPRPLRVLVFAVDGVRPPWDRRCEGP